MGLDGAVRPAQLAPRMGYENAHIQAVYRYQPEPIDYVTSFFHALCLKAPGPARETGPGAMLQICRFYFPGPVDRSKETAPAIVHQDPRSFQAQPADKASSSATDRVEAIHASQGPAASVAGVAVNDCK